MKESVALKLALVAGEQESNRWPGVACEVTRHAKGIATVVSLPSKNEDGPAIFEPALSHRSHHTGARSFHQHLARRARLDRAGIKFAHLGGGDGFHVLRTEVESKIALAAE